MTTCGTCINAVSRVAVPEATGGVGLLQGLQSPLLFNRHLDIRQFFQSARSTVLARGNTN